MNTKKKKYVFPRDKNQRWFELVYIELEKHRDGQKFVRKNWLIANESNVIVYRGCSF